MLLATLAMLAMSGAATAPSSDEALTRLKAKAAACINSNAASVEQNEASLPEALSFLLEDLCVEPVSAFERYRANKVLLARMSSGGGLGWTFFPPLVDADKTQQAYRAQLARQIARYKTAKIDPDNGQLIFAPNGPDDDGDPLSSLEDISSEGASATASLEFRALAGRAVLDARQSRLAH